MKSLLKSAVESKQTLEMIYMSSNIKVIAVTETTIKAYCYTKRQFRTFVMENVLSVGPIRRRGVC
ncbi:hypothetical protein J22TS1_41950 [Siminovitchia terrae]|nr:hypothetical protein J22TS1_41950 [Siminovitchia terrae]